ncbi:MAG: RagB/SusD family nutrient uptake outer membrane protein, partial [Chitinophagaceae bacterium]|nr:RagB/SusD family nutrient uptake outer membrane protein [Chitinophagaceae bacterium]
MKNSGTKLTIILLLFTFCVACQKDLLETSPKDQINNSSFWKTKQDAVNAVNALYPFLPDYTEVDWDRMTDIATTNIPSQATVTIEKGEHDASLPYFKVKWNDGYKAIRAANYFLENADRVKQADATMDETTLTRLKSEARFIRAFSYVRLIMLFGDVPLITKTIDITEAKSVSRTPK